MLGHASRVEDEQHPFFNKADTEGFRVEETDGRNKAQARSTSDQSSLRAVNRIGRIGYILIACMAVLFTVKVVLPKMNGDEPAQSPSVVPVDELIPTDKKVEDITSILDGDGTLEPIHNDGQTEEKEEISEDGDPSDSSSEAAHEATAVSPTVEKDDISGSKEDESTNNQGDFDPEDDDRPSPADPNFDVWSETEAFEAEIAQAAQRCRELKASRRFTNKTTYEYKLASANCGWDYAFPNANGKVPKPMRIALVGPAWTSTVLKLSGCPMGVKRTCPMAPECSFTRVRTADTLEDFDMAVIFQIDAKVLAHRLPKQKRRVLYYREGHYSYVPHSVQNLFDFQMGVHFYSQLYNPNFLRRPDSLLSGAIPPFPPIRFVPLPQRKSSLAMALVSHCNAPSLRENYIHRLNKVLQLRSGGTTEIDLYGKCFNTTLRIPPSLVNNAAKLIAQYKFFLAFENVIEDGYVSEKLLWVLNLPVVPVYFGAPNVPNVTITPSFIKATDFRNPESLAPYLLHLHTHPEEYMKYHAWRKAARPFTEEYLDAVRFKVAGPEELMQYPSAKFGQVFDRSAQCCRLCDVNFVRRAVAERKAQGRKSFVTLYPHEEIVKRYLSGRAKPSSTGAKTENPTQAAAP